MRAWKELLVISQDTSAYGVDVRYRTGFWDGAPVKTRMLDLCEKLGELAEPHGAWVRLHYVYPYPHVDDILPLMARGLVLPYLDVPLQHSHPDVLKRMKRPASGERNLERIDRWRQTCPQIVVRSTFITGFPGETEAEFEHLLDFIPRGPDRSRRMLRLLARGWRNGQRVARYRCRLPFVKSGARGSWKLPKRLSIAKLRGRIGSTMQVLVDSAPALGRRGGSGRTYADAPEIDGTVQLLAPEKASKTLKVGEFTRARIVSAQGHDLIAQPI